MVKNNQNYIKLKYAYIYKKNINIYNFYPVNAQKNILLYKYLISTIVLNRTKES